jgi:hypothetical protein
MKGDFSSEKFEGLLSSLEEDMNLVTTLIAGAMALEPLRLERKRRANTAYLTSGPNLDVSTPPFDPVSQPLDSATTYDSPQSPTYVLDEEENVKDLERRRVLVSTTAPETSFGQRRPNLHRRHAMSQSQTLPEFPRNRILHQGAENSYENIDSDAGSSHSESSGSQTANVTHFEALLQGPRKTKLQATLNRSPRVPNPSDAGPTGGDSKRRVSHRATTTHSNDSEIWLRVDASAPLSLQFSGDMDGRTLQILPAENGMADIVIGQKTGRDGTATDGRGSIMEEENLAKLHNPKAGNTDLTKTYSEERKSSEVINEIATRPAVISSEQWIPDEQAENFSRQYPSPVKTQPLLERDDTPNVRDLFFPPQENPLSILHKSDISGSQHVTSSEMNIEENARADPPSYGDMVGPMNTNLDSGYGSVPNAISMNNKENDDAHSIRSVITNASRVLLPPEEGENLISAFAGDLYQDIGFYDKSDDACGHLSTRLPELLKTFTLRLEKNVGSKTERDAKEFVRQQRK